MWAHNGYGLGTALVLVLLVNFSYSTSVSISSSDGLGISVDSSTGDITSTTVDGLVIGNELASIGRSGFTVVVHNASSSTATGDNMVDNFSFETQGAKKKLNLNILFI